jgi:hypothetical protein
MRAGMLEALDFPRENLSALPAKGGSQEDQLASHHIHPRYTQEKDASVSHSKFSEERKTARGVMSVDLRMLEASEGCAAGRRAGIPVKKTG